jgi:hypothetical protein
MAVPRSNRLPHQNCLTRTQTPTQLWRLIQYPIDTLKRIRDTLAASCGIKNYLFHIFEQTSTIVTGITVTNNHGADNHPNYCYDATFIGSLSMLLPTWLTQKSTSRVAFLLGGTAAEIRQHLTTSGITALTTICDRATAEQLSQAALLDGQRPPAVMISRGFRQDCDALMNAPKPSITLVHHAIFTLHIEAEQSKLANRLQLLGGYQVPDVLVERVALTGVWQHAENLSRRLALPLLIHLPKMPAVPMNIGASDTAFTIFEFPDSSPPPRTKPPETKPDSLKSHKSDKHPATAAMPVQPPVQTATVSSEAAAAHAKFLVDMDLDLLCTLHSSLAIDRDQMIFGFWDNTLTSYERASGQSALVIIARSKLAAVRARVLSPPRSVA